MSVRRADLRQTRRDFIQTALLAPSVLSILGNSLCFAEDIKPGVTEPNVEETLAAIKAMNATSASNVTPERLAACDTIQRSVDRLRASEFGEYFKSDAETAKKWEEERGVLRFLNASFDKVLTEIRETKVAEGRVALWHKFVSAYEIDCGPKSGNCVIFHVGDACNVNQIKSTAPVDVFIPHLAVGLDVPKAVNTTLCPKVTLLSHILELGHLIDKWRWSYEYGFNVCKKCANDSVLLPVWGEKYEFRR